MTLPRILLAACLATSGYTAGRLTGNWEHRALEGQVVLIYDHRQVIEGQELDVVSVNPQARVLLAIAPLDGQAPLPPNSLMICTLFSEMHGQPIPRNLEPKEGEVLYGGLRTNIGFKCSGRRYEFSKMDIQQ